MPKQQFMWQQVQAPDFRGTADLMSNAGNAFNTSFDTLKGLSNDQRTLAIKAQDDHDTAMLENAKQAILSGAKTSGDLDKMDASQYYNNLPETKRADFTKFYQDLSKDLTAKDQTIANTRANLINAQSSLMNAQTSKMTAESNVATNAFNLEQAKLLAGRNANFRDGLSYIAHQLQTKLENNKIGADNVNREIQSMLLLKNAQGEPYFTTDKERDEASKILKQQVEEHYKQSGSTKKLIEMGNTAAEDTFNKAYDYNNIQNEYNTLQQRKKGVSAVSELTNPTTSATDLAAYNQTLEDVIPNESAREKVRALLNNPSVQNNILSQIKEIIPQLTKGLSPERASEIEAKYTSLMLTPKMKQILVGGLSDNYSQLFGKLKFLTGYSEPAIVNNAKTLVRAMAEKDIDAYNIQDRINAIEPKYTALAKLKDFYATYHQERSMGGAVNRAKEALYQGIIEGKSPDELAKLAQDLSVDNLVKTQGNDPALTSNPTIDSFAGSAYANTGLTGGQNLAQNAGQPYIPSPIDPFQSERNSLTPTPPVSSPQAETAKLDPLQQASDAVNAGTTKATKQFLQATTGSGQSIQPKTANEIELHNSGYTILAPIPNKAYVDSEGNIYSDKAKTKMVARAPSNTSATRFPTGTLPNSGDIALSSLEGDLTPSTLKQLIQQARTRYNNNRARSVQ